MAGRRFGAFYARSFEKHPYITLAAANGTLGVVADSLAQGFERFNKPNDRLASKSDATATDAGPQGWDLARSARFLTFGIGMAPLLAEWNHFIEHRFPLRTSSTANTSTTSAAASNVGARSADAARTFAKLTGSSAAADVLADKAKWAGNKLAASDVGSKITSAGKVSIAALGKRVAIDQGLFAPFGLAMFVLSMGIMEGRSFSGIQEKFSEMYFPALIANWQLWPAVQLVNFRFVPLRYRVPFTSSIGILWTLYLSLLNTSKTSSRKEVAATDPVST
ncbi:unnamed protein product [Tilletia controversa]|uniref:Protein SYM1 n=3 Tax=Tilletia TaxID=13289 RepID=A0A8X7SZB2_9BASI|nr:hypothetical protein CF336_g1629 [Tilletia laevis]KAE8201131.1 hypothetical protein CF328_g2765 [Tilletia controversa]KAE8263365.1 hypothetical protein A4X03_0g1731 [Tilletia caries]KAE8207844.1 hypothetical protein CF335_g852 [Tilletia laevis]KAE8253450.1 hypothetical protein A4X06_0g1451 [Tilletia controversa]